MDRSVTEAEKISQRMAEERARKTSKSTMPSKNASKAPVPTVAICTLVIPSLAVRLTGRRPRATSRRSWTGYARTRLANSCGEVGENEPERIETETVASI